MAFDTTKKVTFVASVDGADRVRSGFAGIRAGLLDTQRAAGLARTAMAGFAGVAGASLFAEMVNGAIDAKAKLYDVGLQTGISVEALGGLSKVAKFSGTSLDEIASASAKLSKALATNNEDSKGAAQAIKALGLEYNTFKALGADEQLLAVAKAMEGFADGTGKTATAMLLFGKTGATLLPFLKELSERGLMVTKQTTESALAAKEYQDNLVALRGAGEGLANNIATALLPGLVALTNELVTIKGEGAEVSIVATGIKTAFEALAVLGANVAFVFGGVGREIGAIAAQGAALARGDFGGIRAISAAVIEDGKRARAELDALERRLMGIKEIVSAGAGRGFTNPVTAPRPGLDIQSPKDAVKGKVKSDAEHIAKLQADAEEQAAKDAAEAWGFWGKYRLDEAKDRADAEILQNKQVFDFIDQQIAEEEERMRAAANTVFVDSPLAGANRALQDYLAEIAATGRATERIVGDALHGLEDGLTNLFTKGRFDARSFIDALISEFIRLRVVKPLLSDIFSTGSSSGGGAGLFATLGSFFGFRADGGPVSAGSPYIVGERGPELFVPQSAGTVLPNGAGMGGTTIVLNQSITNHVDSRTDRAQVAQLVGQAVAQGNQQFAAQLRAQGVL